MLDKPLIDQLPGPADVRFKLGSALREVELLRRLLRLAQRAEEFRQMDRQYYRAVGREVSHA